MPIELIVLIVTLLLLGDDRARRVPRGSAAVAGEIPMTGQGLLQLGLYIAVLVLLVKPLGAFMAAVYEGRRTFLSPVFGGTET